MNFQIMWLLLQILKVHGSCSELKFAHEVYEDHIMIMTKVGKKSNLLLTEMSLDIEGTWLCKI